MKRFRKFIDAELNVENVKNSAQLNSYGITCTYLPDPVEDFDEFEFRTDFGGKENIVISFALEMGKIKRLIISEANEHNPDVVKGLTADRLESLLSQKGDDLERFFEFITGVS